MVCHCLHRCNGTTQAGKRCKRKVRNSLYCYQHKEQAAYIVRIRTRKLEDCNDIFSKKCSICWTDFKDTDFILFKCEHAVCTQCFIPMILTKPECPECRNVIVDEDIECTYPENMEEAKNMDPKGKTYGCYKIMPH